MKSFRLDKKLKQTTCFNLLVKKVGKETKQSIALICMIITFLFLAQIQNCKEETFKPITILYFQFSTVSCRLLFLLRQVEC
jgi:hypothetical protein